METNSGPEAYKLRQQNIQLRYSLKYKDEVEIPTLRRRMQELEQERKELDSQLLENRKQDDFLNRHTGLIHLDNDNRIIKINEYALVVLGLSHAQTIGRDIAEVGVHRDSGKPIFGDISYYLEPQGKQTGWEKEISMPNGEKRYYRMSALLLEGTRLISIADQTALRVSESRVKAIIGSSKDGILVVDDAGNIQFTNSRFGKLFDINWRSVHGMPFHVAAELLLYHFADDAEFQSFYSSVLHDRECHLEKQFEMVLPHKASFQIYTRPIFDDRGQIIGRVWFITDVTTFKELERELEEKVQERTEELFIQNQELVQVKQHLEKQSMDTEMELDMAKQVQEGLLPKNLPEMPGYHVHTTYLPTKKIGGDFYDFIPLDGERVFFLMADASGHGVPAALVTAMAKMSFDRHVKPELTVSEILRRVNLELCEAIKTDHYLTAFAGILEIRTGRLRYSRVCHPYPVLYRHASRKLEHLQMRGGFFLGMFEDNEFAEEETEVHPGDLLFVYTDGINESFNQKDEQYGRDRLDTVILRHGNMGAREVITQVQLDKERFVEGRPSLDDITIFSIHRQAET